MTYHSDAQITVTQTCACDETRVTHTMSLRACQQAATWLERLDQQITCGYCGQPVVTRCKIVEHAHVS